MLNDIFSRRYDGTPLRDSFEERDSGLLIQAFRIVSEDIYPCYSSGNVDKVNAAIWKKLEADLARELGLRELSSHWLGTYHLPPSQVCEAWMVFPQTGWPDTHVKHRLSLIELAFRAKDKELAGMNARPLVDALTELQNFGRHGFRLPGDPAEGEKARRKQLNERFAASVEELNTRFRQAHYPLHYHNGFIQFANDERIQQEIENPFWSLVAGPDWQNVDVDMKEAIDRRDNDGRDPVFYAARALESAIKIVSDKKGWTHGSEKGAHNYIDNLAALKNSFISAWESRSLKDFFTHVRNPFGHGPGSGQMPSLSRPQTDWAIEFSMSWIKNLVRRC